MSSIPTWDNGMLIVTHSWKKKKHTQFQVIAIDSNQSLNLNNRLIQKIKINPFQMYIINQLISNQSIKKNKAI